MAALCTLQSRRPDRRKIFKIPLLDVVIIFFLIFLVLDNQKVADMYIM
jgi:hypothetical protein